MPCRQGLYKRWLVGRPGKPRLTGKTCEDARCSRSFSLGRHLQSPGGLRQAWSLVLPDKGLTTSASTCWNSWPTERAEEKGRFPQGFGHEPCSYDSGARLAGSVPLVQPPEDDLPQGASRHLGAMALAQAHHKRALEVTRIRVPWGELLLLHRLERKVSGQ